MVDFCFAKWRRQSRVILASGFLEEIVCCGCGEINRERLTETEGQCTQNNNLCTRVCDFITKYMFFLSLSVRTRDMGTRNVLY